MSTQTVAKLRRLLEIETAKRIDAEKRYSEAMRHYSDASWRAVVAEVRVKQAIEILSGEDDERKEISNARL